MRNVIFLGFLSAALVVAGVTTADDGADKQAKSSSVWMKKKLDYSEEILAGIAVADFDRVSVAAGHMRTLNKVESFARARNPAYRDQLKAFQEANEEILRRAEAKDVDGAAAAFSSLTTSCIRCHKDLRDQAAK